MSNLPVQRTLAYPIIERIPQIDTTYLSNNGFNIIDVFYPSELPKKFYLNHGYIYRSIAVLPNLHYKFVAFFLVRGKVLRIIFETTKSNMELFYKILPVNEILTLKPLKHILQNEYNIKVK